MAINESVKDLINNPTRTKTVTLDLQKIVPIDNNGDEVYVLSASGVSTVDKINGGTITPIFIRDFKAGYAKSSGFKNPPFTVTSGTSTFRVSVDGSTFRDITLSTGTGLTGPDIASDMQAKINALAGVGGVEEGNLGFLNATVEFVNNRFKFISGSVSNTYTGAAKSSFVLSSGTSNDGSVLLGLDKGVNSEALSSKIPVETTVTIAYSGGVTLDVASTESMEANEAFTIYDGVNREYFVASGTAVGEITILGSGLVNNYDVGAVVQKIFERDATAQLASPYEDIDSIVRFSLQSISSQIDFTV